MSQRPLQSRRVLADRVDRGLFTRRLGAGGQVPSRMVPAGLGSEAAPRVLDTPAEWFGVLADIFGMPLTDLTAAERDRLWRRVIGAHETWLAGR